MLPIVLNLHLYNMVLVLATFTIAGIWGLVLYFRDKKPEALSQPWKIALIVAAADGALQGLLGVILVLLGQKPDGSGNMYYLHYVYGGIVALGLPIAYTYASKNVRVTVLILAIVSLVIAAAGARAMMTGLGIGS